MRLFQLTIYYYGSVGRTPDSKTVGHGILVQRQQSGGFVANHLFTAIVDLVGAS